MSSLPPPTSMEARLRDASRSGVFFAQPTAAARAARVADQAGLLLIGLDLKDARDRTALLQAFADTFGFPATFGHNLDALGDCLGDLSWIPAGGYLVHLSGCAKPVCSRAGRLSTKAPSRCSGRMPVLRRLPAAQ